MVNNALLVNDRRLLFFRFDLVSNLKACIHVGNMNSNFAAQFPILASALSKQFQEIECQSKCLFRWDIRTRKTSTTRKSFSSYLLAWSLAFKDTKHIDDLKKWKITPASVIFEPTLVSCTVMMTTLTMHSSTSLCTSFPARCRCSKKIHGGGGYSMYPRVGRYGPAPCTLTLFKTNIPDFPTLFETEFQFFIPCLRHLTRIKSCGYKLCVFLVV